MKIMLTLSLLLLSASAFGQAPPPLSVHLITDAKSDILETASASTPGAAVDTTVTVSPALVNLGDGLPHTITVKATSNRPASVLGVRSNQSLYAAITPAGGAIQGVTVGSVPVVTGTVTDNSETFVLKVAYAPGVVVDAASVAGAGGVLILPLPGAKDQTTHLAFPRRIDGQQTAVIAWTVQEAKRP